MAELTAKYEIKLPSPILVNGKEVLAKDPIEVTTSIGEAVIYPPGSKTMKPESYVEPQEPMMPMMAEFEVSAKGSRLWKADTIWIDVRTEITSPASPQQLEQQLHSEVRRISLWVLKLLRQRCPEPPMPLPKHLKLAYSMEYKPTPQEAILASGFGGVRVRVPSEGAGLTGERWQQLSQDIASEATPELHDEFILDAKVALDEEDLIRAILYAAIACEIFIKEYAEKAAKEANIDPKFWQYLKRRRPRVLDYYDSILCLVKGRSLQDESRQQYQQLSYLFEARNNIMHEGKPYYEHGGKRVDLTHTLGNQLIDDAIQAISWVRGL